MTRTAWRLLPMQCLLFVCFAITAITACELSLPPVELLEAGKADGFILTPDEKGLALDSRNARFPLTGVLLTGTLDPQDPQNRLIAEPSAWVSLTVKIQASLPAGAAARVEVRTGNRFFSDSGWTGWTPISGLADTLEKPQGRFVRLRLTFTAQHASASPVLTALTLLPVHLDSLIYAKRFRLVSFMNDRITGEQTNQSAIKATRIAEKKILLEFGHSQPLFRRFVASINDSAAREVPAVFEWGIADGANKLKVFPEDKEGKRGNPSFIGVYY